MTDAEDQVQDAPTVPSTVRLWLALLMMALVALLPGPEFSGDLRQTKQLTAPTMALTALHGRDLITRQDEMQIRPLAANALPPSGPLLPPPRVAVALSFLYHPHLGVGAGTLAPRARAPPFFA